MSWETADLSLLLESPLQILPPGQLSQTAGSKEGGLFHQLRALCSLRLSILKTIFSEKYHLHPHFGFHTPVITVSEIRAVHKINQQELALKQLRSLTIAPYTSNTNLFCKLPQKFFRQTKTFNACVRDLVFVDVGLLCLKESVSIVTFTVYSLSHHFCLFPQFPKLIQK